MIAFRVLFTVACLSIVGHLRAIPRRLILQHASHTIPTTGRGPTASTVSWSYPSRATLGISSLLLTTCYYDLLLTTTTYDLLLTTYYFCFYLLLLTTYYLLLLTTDY